MTRGGTTRTIEPLAATPAEQVVRLDELHAIDTKNTVDTNENRP